MRRRGRIRRHQRESLARELAELRAAVGAGRGTVEINGGRARIHVVGQDEPLDMRDPGARARTTRALLFCVETERGACVVQRQTAPPSRAELRVGVWSLCGRWLETREPLARLTPSCDECLKDLRVSP